MICPAFLVAGLSNRQNMNSLSVGAGHARDILTNCAESEAPRSRAWPAPTSLNLRMCPSKKSVQQWCKNRCYLLPGKFARLPVDDLSLLVDNQRKGYRVDVVAQLMGQGNAGDAAE